MKTLNTLAALSLSNLTRAPRHVYLLPDCGALLALLLPGLTGCGSSSAPMTARTNPASTAAQAPDASSQTRDIETNQANAIKFEAMIAEAEKHLQRNADGTLSLNETTSRAAGLNEETRLFAESALAHTNAIVRSGEVTVDENFKLHATDPSRRIWVDGWHWWGVTVAFDNDSTQKLVSSLKGNNLKNAVSLFGNAVDGNILGIIKTLLSVSWGYTIDYVNNSGGRHGVNVNVTWSTFMWVTSR